MRHIMQVLERIGWKRGSHEDDWRLLWTFEYPFQRFQDKLLKLKPHQKVHLNVFSVHEEEDTCKVCTLSVPLST